MSKGTMLEGVKSNITMTKHQWHYLPLLWTFHVLNIPHSNRWVTLYHHSVIHEVYISHEARNVLSLFQPGLALVPPVPAITGAPFSVGWSIFYTCQRSRIFHGAPTFLWISQCCCWKPWMLHTGGQTVILCIWLTYQTAVIDLHHGCVVGAQCLLHIPFGVV